MVIVITVVSSCGVLCFRHFVGNFFLKLSNTWSSSYRWCWGLGRLKNLLRITLVPSESQYSNSTQSHLLITALYNCARVNWTDFVFLKEVSFGMIKNLDNKKRNMGCIFFPCGLILIKNDPNTYVHKI